MHDPPDMPPFLLATVKETPLQRILRDALAHVQRFGLCEWTDERQPSGFHYLSVCGLPMRSDPPNMETLMAARAILDEVAGGSGGEDDCFELDYVAALDAIMIFFDSCDFGDAQACAFVEQAYAKAGRRFVRSRAPAVTSIILLH